MLFKAAIMLMLTLNYLMLQLRQFTNNMYECLIYIIIDSNQLLSYFRYLTNLSLVIALPNQTQYKKRCLETSLSGPSIFSGLPLNNILPVPTCFPTNLMYLVSLNLPDLFANL